MIKEIIEKMRHLQDLLLKKFANEEQLAQLPRSLDTKQEMVDRLKFSCSEKKLRYEELLRKVTSNRRSLDELEKRREQDERTISMITTQREYEALDKEIQSSVIKEQVMRKDILRVEKEIGEIEESISQEEELIATQEEALVKEWSRVEKETKVHLDSLKKLGTQEQKLTEGIDDELLFKFERIVRRKGSKGIVPVKGVVCTGCHMILPNQFVNDVRHGEKILFCPYCSKILFFVEEEEQVSIDQLEIGGLVSLFEEEGAVDEEAEIEVFSEEIEDDDLEEDQKIDDIDDSEDDIEDSDEGALADHEAEEDDSDEDFNDHSDDFDDQDTEDDE